MHIIITGCGRVGSQLAQFLAYEGHDVVIIDRDEESFTRLPDGFNGIAMTGIAFDEELLLEAGIQRAHALAAVTNYDNTNLMVAEIAARLYQVPRVVARLYNPERRHVFAKLGVNFVCGTTLVAERIMDMLLQRDVVVLQERLDVGVKVVEFAIPWQAGKVVAGDLEDGTNSRILALERAGRQLRWDGNTRLLVGDRVVLVVKREGWKDLEDTLDVMGLRR
jgi:trk system potassium uptake protein TrkA